MKYHQVSYYSIKHFPKESDLSALGGEPPWPPEELLHGNASAAYQPVSFGTGQFKEQAASPLYSPAPSLPVLKSGTSENSESRLNAPTYFPTAHIWEPPKFSISSHRKPF